MSAEDASAPFLHFLNVWQEYGEHTVLEKIQLRVNRGEFCTLVGASGCGKSSFLRLLLGQEKPSRGRILIEGRPLAAEPDATRGIVFQRHSVFPHLCVRDNVLLGPELQRSPLSGRLLGRAREAAHDQAEAMLKAVGLFGSMHKHPHQLTGGQQQRLAIAQALVLRPRLLLLDEPFGALDPGTRKDLHALLLDLWKQTGVTVFMATRDLSEGFRLGTRLLVFDKARHDPYHPDAYGSRITYDILLNQDRRAAIADTLPPTLLEKLAKAAAPHG